MRGTFVQLIDASQHNLISQALLSANGNAAVAYTRILASVVAISGQKIALVSKGLGNPIKSRAAVQTAATNVCLVSLTTRNFGVPLHEIERCSRRLDRGLRADDRLRQEGR
jgi:hypothetical protein